MHVSKWNSFTICDKTSENEMVTALKYALIQIQIYLWIKLALRTNSVWNITILIKRLWLWLRISDNLSIYRLYHIYNQFEAVWSISWGFDSHIIAQKCVNFRKIDFIINFSKKKRMSKKIIKTWNSGYVRFSRSKIDCMRALRKNRLK